MEHRIFEIIRSKINIPYFIRMFFGFILIFLSLIPIILPLFPGSLFLGVFMCIVGFLLIVPGKKIRHVIKLRKGIFYLAKNIHKKRIIEHKMKDFRDHIRDILQDKKKRRKKRIIIKKQDQI